MTFDSSEVKNLCLNIIRAKLKYLLISSAFFWRWPVHNRIGQCTEFGTADLNSSFDLQISIAPSSSRGRVPCLSNAIILFEIGNLWASFCVTWIGIFSAEDEGRGYEVGFVFSFDASLSAPVRECCTIVDSWTTGCPVLAEVFAILPWIRLFTVKSLTGLLRPLEILNHDWVPSLDKKSTLISTPGFTWW